MKKQYQNSQDQFTDNESTDLEDLLLDEENNACMIIRCSSAGELSFSCDWDDGDDGVAAMASLLANLGDEHITTKIIKNLEMSSKTEEDKKRLSQIKILCSAIKKILDQNNKTADDEVVISPLDACSLL
jgi:hypothetical protein